MVVTELRRFGLPPETIADIQRVFAQNAHVERVLLFGSRAMGTYKNGSDIDLALFGTYLTYTDLIDLRTQLDALPYAYTFDLIDYARSSNPALKAHIDDIGLPFYEQQRNQLPEGWREGRLGELAEIIMGQSPTGDTCNGKGIGIPLLNGPTEFGSYSPIAVQYTTDSKRTSRKNDILFCVRGSTTGRMNWSNLEYAIGRGLAAIRHKEGNKYQPFLRGLIDSSLNRILGLTTGSTFPNISGEQLKKLSTLIPPLPIQKEIASILSALDDKIELNRQMNQTLESIAQTLFTEWFVKFNFPGFDGELVDGLPKGWRRGALGEVCTNARQTVQPQEIKHDTPYVGLEHVPRKSLAISDWGKSQEVESQKSLFKKGDILFGKLRPYFHKVSIAPVNGICSTDILVIRPTAFSYHGFIVQHLFSDEMIKYVSGIADGTRMPRVDWKSIANFEIIIPDDAVLYQFNDVVEPLYQKLMTTAFDNQTLTQLRDSLLPRLLSGKIAVGA